MPKHKGRKMKKGKKKMKKGKKKMKKVYRGY